MAFIVLVAACSRGRGERPEEGAEPDAGPDWSAYPDGTADAAAMADHPGDTRSEPDGKPVSGGFRERVVFEGLSQPTALRFARDGRVFVAEKGGLIKQYASVEDSRPVVVADLSAEVHGCGDRGLLDIELDPDFPSEPHIYALHTLDGRIGDTVAGGSVPRYRDTCPGQDVATHVAAGRLVRLTLGADVAATGRSQRILVENWAQPFISHSVGSLAFGPDRLLYASAGDGANFNHVDYGQLAGNPLREPPDPASNGQKPPTAMGGALRAQVTEPPAGGAVAFPTSYSGKVIRIDPRSDQPPVMVASGLRNPFRMAFRPATPELWIGDVGWIAWEEINRIRDVRRAEVPNFGWPCFEGSQPQPGYQAVGLDLCTALYARPSASLGPVFAYSRGAELADGDGCGRGQSAVTGLAFHGGGAYPAEYAGALFFADFARQCIWVMPAGADGVPDPTKRRVFARGTPQPVDLRSGPEGDLYYLDFRGGTVRRFEYDGGNHAPRATVVASSSLGPLPLAVTFDASDSEDPDSRDSLVFEWDLDGDGRFDDGSGRMATHTYTERGRVVVSVRVSDPRGARATASVVVWPGHTLPVPNIESVTPRAWRTGDRVVFRGYATDADGRRMPSSALHWSVVVHHCPDGCHEHPLEQFDGTDGGAFIAPDHEYPMHLSLELRAEADGLVAVTREVLMPRTASLLLQSRPSGLRLAVNGAADVTPFSRTTIQGSAISVSAPSQVTGTTAYRFLRWSNGAEQNHVLVSEPRSRPLVAVFEPIALEAVQRAASRILVHPGSTGTPDAGARSEIERIRDGVKPALGATDAGQQFLLQGLAASGEPVRLGYEFTRPQLFARLVFQEGMHFDDGGYLDSIGVEVRQGGQWLKVKTLKSTPVYLGYNVVGWETFFLDFEPVMGDAIRLVGEPGGAARYLSVAELEVWAAPVESAGPAP
jgi:glucose/arabinose dehydrogenase